MVVFTKEMLRHCCTGNKATYIFALLVTHLSSHCSPAKGFLCDAWEKTSTTALILSVSFFLF